MIQLPPVRWLAAGCAQADEARKVREARPNWGPRIRDYLANCDPPIPCPAAWCAAAVQFWTDTACRAWGVRNPLDDVGREAYVRDYAALATERGWIVPPSMADLGDLILFDWQGTGWDHIGLVLRPPNDEGAVLTVEGNTGPPTGSQRDGDGVYLKTRSTRAGYKILCVRWDGEIPREMDPPQLRAA